MKASPDSTGDLGEFIVAELDKRGVPLPEASEPSRLPATWRTFTIELEGDRTGLAVAAQGCSWEKVVAFLFTLLSPCRVHRPFSKDNDNSFWFSFDGKEGNFKRTDRRLVILFITCGVSLVVGESQQGLDLGFSKHPTNSGYSAQEV